MFSFSRTMTNSSICIAKIILGTTGMVHYFSLAYTGERSIRLERCQMAIRPPIGRILNSFPGALTDTIST